MFYHNIANKKTIVAARAVREPPLHAIGSITHDILFLPRYIMKSVFFGLLISVSAIIVMGCGYVTPPTSTTSLFMKIPYTVRT
jgi:hypothetical protein